MITVVNKKTAGPPLDDSIRIYVGRPTPLGNPFSHMNNTLAQFLVKDREEAVAKYRVWLLDEIKRSPEINHKIHMIKDLARNSNIELECWCYPQPCHADVIKQVIEAELKNAP